MFSAVNIDNLSHKFGDRIALDKVTFSCPQGQLMGILGPNGSGKSTLLRILATSLQPQSGRGEVCGLDLCLEETQIRKKIGVVFQTPSLDKRLTVIENLYHHGYLQGLWGKKLRERVSLLIEELGLISRSKELVETLSGGFQRRVELAKSMIHRPKLILMDEPTAGVDIKARLNFWNLLKKFQDQEGASVIFTTHLIEEAENCDSLIILDEGVVVADESPGKLRESVGGEVIWINSENNKELGLMIMDSLEVNVEILKDGIRIESDDGLKILSEIVNNYSPQITSIKSSRSSLEDVFFRKTGKKFYKGS